MRSGRRTAGFLVITHYQRLLDYIKPDVVHIMSKGRIVKTGRCCAGARTREERLPRLCRGCRLRPPRHERHRGLPDPGRKDYRRAVPGASCARCLDDVVAERDRKPIAAFSAAGLPHRRIEAWHYTDLRSMLREVLPPAEHRRTQLILDRCRADADCSSGCTGRTHRDGGRALRGANCRSCRQLPRSGCRRYSTSVDLAGASGRAGVRRLPEAVVALNHAPSPLDGVAIVVRGRESGSRNRSRSCPSSRGRQPAAIYTRTSVEAWRRRLNSRSCRTTPLSRTDARSQAHHVTIVAFGRPEPASTTPLASPIWRRTRCMSPRCW